MKIPNQQVVRFCLLLLFLSLITFVYWILYKKPVAGIDDADIYFTYVKNFVNGHGFVFYPGGERVEGFTSLMWVLLGSVFYAIDSDQYPRYLLMFNVVLVTSALFLCCNFIRRLTRDNALITPGEILFLVLLTLIPGYIDWTILTLMETGLWSFLLIVISVLACTFDPHSRRDRVMLSVLLALLITVRPESLMWSFVFVFLMFVKSFLHLQSVRPALKNVMLPLVVVVVGITALTLFRLEYFGYPLPNTYYAKVSTDKVYNLIAGVKYLIRSIIQSPVLLLVTLAGCVSWIASVTTLYSDIRYRIMSTEATWFQFTLSTVTVLAVALPAFTGGDHFKLLRFYQPFFPVFVLVFFNIDFWKQFVSVNLNFGGVYRYAAAISFIPFIYLCTDTPLHVFKTDVSPIDWEFRLAELGREDARKMNLLFSRLDTLPSVGVSTAGGFGYMYNGKVLDLMGLNNVRMAHALEVKTGFKNHAAFDINTFYALQPDIFHCYFRGSTFVESIGNNQLYENDPGFDTAFMSNLYKGIFRKATFREMYRPVLIQDPESKLILQTYVKVSFIPELVNNGYHIHQEYWHPRKPEEPAIATNDPAFQPKPVSLN